MTEIQKVILAIAFRVLRIDCSESLEMQIEFDTRFNFIASLYIAKNSEQLISFTLKLLRREYFNI